MFNNIAIIFISIFFEAMPFLLLGALISAVIESFISDDTLEKLIPKNKFLGSIVGIFLGFFLPCCDCGVIPVAKRLIKKGVPLNVAIPFMLASPIINPVVLLSTYYAFYKTNPSILWYRLILGISIALIIGIIISIIFNKKEVILNNNEKDNNCHCNEHKKDKKIIHIFKHTAIDFYEVLKFLIIGAILASLIQVLLPQNILAVFNGNHILSILALMIFAYLISLCSTSDSFVGKSLLTSFSQTSIIAYLLLGPMIDIKNTIVLLGNYKKSFVITLITLIFIFVFLSACLIEVLL